MELTLFAGGLVGVFTFGLPWWILVPCWGAAAALFRLGVKAEDCERRARARIRRQECVWCGQKLDDNLCGRCGR